MGSCVSTGTTTSDAINLPPKAKIITIAGGLMEHANPVAASDVLGGDSPACFLCSSDSLYCDEYIRALHPEELLRPGEIYFVLPSVKLRYPLSGVDLAALAVRASSALAPLMSERGSRRSKKIRVVPAPHKEGDWDGSGGVDGQAKRNEEMARPVAPPAVVQRKMKRSGSAQPRVAYRHYRYSRATLSTIPELVE